MPRCLLQVGGQGDSRENPADPFAAPITGIQRFDDELYRLENLIPAGATAATVFTQNPSGDGVPPAPGCSAMCLQPPCACWPHG